MSEGKTLEEEEKEASCQALKVSDLLGQQGEQQSYASIQKSIAAQLQNNQELYTTLSRSLLELHNDMRQFRKNEESFNKMLFSLQQGVNKANADIAKRLAELEASVAKLTDLWNSCVKKAEGTKDATDGEGKENS
jgi:uncharacterized protein YukE